MYDKKYLSIGIIGAGIAGPAAALALGAAGYRPKVYEARTVSSFVSQGVLGIRNNNWDALQALGAGLQQYELEADYTDWVAGTSRPWSEGHFITHADLHHGLTAAASGSGASFFWGEAPDTQYMRANHDVIVHANGVGYAAGYLLPTYTGYVVYRGVTSTATDYPWLSFNDPDKRFNFKLAYTREGSSWELYAHRVQPVFKTITAHDVPPEVALLPRWMRQYVSKAQIQPTLVTPISDWDVPRHLMDRWGTDFTIGDANGTMRPQTGMGANLGIHEGLAMPLLLDTSWGDGPADRTKLDAAEIALLADRAFQRARGLRIGMRVLGE